jgi:NADH:ubiquinone oxidoreductase subunit E
MPQTYEHTDDRPFLRSVPQEATAGFRQEIAQLEAKLGDNSPATLVPMLRELKLSHGSIPETAVDEIATVLGLSYAKVHKVASFYAQLHRIDRGAMAA